VAVKRATSFNVVVAETFGHIAHKMINLFSQDVGASRSFRRPT
jgi:hypothetical protein